MSNEIIPAFLVENLLYLLYQQMDLEGKSGRDDGTGNREN